MANDEHKAQLAFTAARAEQEKTVQAQPDYGPAWCVLGVIDAALGRKEDALREGRRAVELLPVERDSINGLHMIENLAMIAAWVGEKDLACEQLATAIRYPSGRSSYGELKLDRHCGTRCAAIRASKKSSPPSRRSKSAPRITRITRVARARPKLVLSEVEGGAPQATGREAVAAATWFRRLGRNILLSQKTRRKTWALRSLRFRCFLVLCRLVSSEPSA